MKIILTNHSKQRREHYEITPDEKIIPWIEYFNSLFDFKSREDAIYKIYYRGKAAVIKKEKNKLIVITIRGFLDFSERKLYKLEIRNEDKIKNNKIYRIDYLNKVVPCGFIEETTFTLKGRLRYKYQMPNFSRKHTINELNNFVTFDKEKKKWMLNDFERK